jgi:hypothetical protein
MVVAQQLSYVAVERTVFSKRDRVLHLLFKGIFSFRQFHVDSILPCGGHLP